MDFPNNSAPSIDPAAPTPVATPVAAPVAAPVQPMGEPTSSGTSFGEALKSFNWVEVGFGIVGAWALYATIYYYRNRLQIDKLMNNNMQKQIDDMKITLQDEINNKQQPISNGNFTQ